MSDNQSVIVVGSGPAGVAVVRELAARSRDIPVTLFGAETWEPYDRVRLSSALAGELPWQALSDSMRLPEDPRILCKFGIAIRAIDRERRVVIDAQGRTYPYSALVLATGSRAHVPNIPGVTLPGAFTFRDLDDAQRLLARRVRSRRTVVLGGGLLGLEAARAMRRFQTQITVVEHAERLMPRQLDAAASALLKAQVEQLGIEVVVADGVAEICGQERVGSVRLRSGRVLDCDTLIIATGIVPNHQLALDAGLPIGRGIKVDDQLRTADASIYAVGECAEHRGTVYGLVAPCLEQAAVAAAAICGESAQYLGSMAATRLKVLNVPVFSAGLTPDEAPRDAVRTQTWREGEGRYRRVVLRHGRLVGALSVGDWPEQPRVLEAVQQQRAVGPLARLRFARSGSLWPESASRSIHDWPAAAIVCNCAGVTRGALSQAIENGCANRAQLAQCTRASTVCGSCAPLLDTMLGGNPKPEPVWGWRWLLGMAAAALLAALLLGLLPGLPYVPQWSLTEWRWDKLWRDGLLKQISGFTLFGLALVGLSLSLRKRMPRIRLGHFPLWRGLHVLLGVLALAVLLLHTGGRLGYGLNAWLMSIFVILSGGGAAASLLIALEHRLSPERAKRARAQLTWLHILTFWPLPALLGFHVLKVYYF